MDTDRKKIMAAWKVFQDDPDAAVGGVRPVILASWRRSRALGVDPGSSPKIVLAPERLDERVRANRLLCDTAVPIMEDLYDFVRGTGFISLLCDRDGYVLKITGDPDVRDAVSANLLVEGASRAESAMGTNAIGTCIFESSPIQVWADEHYYKPHTGWTCSAAPVLDASDRLAGVLCLTGHWDRVTRHTLGMVVSAAKATSKQMALEQSLARTDATRRKLDGVIELLNYGLVFTDGDGRIIQANSLALRLLDIHGVDRSAVVGTLLGDHPAASGLDVPGLVANAGCGREFDLETFVGTLHCSAALIPGGLPGSGREVAITIRRAEHVHRMINRIVGSSARFTWDDIVGGSPALVEAKRLARVAAPYPSNVLLAGESGTGKELFAQAIHNASDRAAAPFIAINCGALPRSLIESELFGYEGGAFTGSRRDGQAGKFELANGGTIFLDEIGDMPFDVQAHLLRVLQTREVVRIGGRKAVHIDVRVISATNRNLADAVAGRTFREDLYYRLNVFAIDIPPLRGRDGDIRILSDHMLARFAANFRKRVSGFSPGARTALEEYSWPGNLRELENTIERAVLVCQGDKLVPSDLPPGIIGGRPERIIHARASAPAPLSAAANEERLIRDAVNAHRGNLRRASLELGIGRSTLYRKLRKYNIDVESDRP